MIKKTFLIVLIVILLIASGCSRDIDEKDQNEVINIESPNQDNVTAPSLGGISLGDSPQIVANTLGNNYTESTELDSAEIIGEDMTVWSYESGIVVILGKTSEKVLRVTSTSQNLQTDLGIKVGDDAKTLSEAYKSLYEKPVSRHSDEVLEGWFLMGDGAIIIFDFDKSDGAVVNSSITSDSSVEEIVLAYWEHFN